ncbi:MAG: hypothetical protein KIS73_19550 [Enhydrobacter sp.]|nr:hypothetical protein [Enhydrobacter sp.]
MSFDRRGGEPLDPYNDLRAPFPELVNDLDDTAEVSFSRSFEFERENDDCWQRVGDIAKRIVEELKASRGD